MRPRSLAILIALALRSNGDRPELSSGWWSGPAFWANSNARLRGDRRQMEAGALVGHLYTYAQSAHELGRWRTGLSRRIRLSKWSPPAVTSTETGACSGE